MGSSPGRNLICRDVRGCKIGIARPSKGLSGFALHLNGTINIQRISRWSHKNRFHKQLKRNFYLSGCFKTRVWRPHDLTKHIDCAIFFCRKSDFSSCLYSCDFVWNVSQMIPHCISYSFFIFANSRHEQNLVPYFPLYICIFHFPQHWLFKMQSSFYATK